MSEGILASGIDVGSGTASLAKLKRMKEEKQYVYLDGMLLNEEHLMKLALNVGSYAMAEHYLFALLAHGVIYGKNDVIHIVNEVREHYGVPKIPLANMEINVKGCEKKNSTDEKVRLIFRSMDKEIRRHILKESLSYLRANYHLFIYARHWLGVYMVIRDRLEGECLTQRNFVSYAIDITPDEWPDTLRICESTAKNFGREIGSIDRGEAYYDMKNNPQEDLCDKFWDIVKQMILTAI